jgi:hypothetical protein
MENHQTTLKLTMILLLLAQSLQTWDYILSVQKLDTQNYNESRVTYRFIPPNFFISAWNIQLPSSTTVSSIQLLMLDSTPSIVKTQIQANSIGGFNTSCDLALDSTNGFVLIWYHTSDPTQCLTSASIYAKYFDSNFTPGVEKQIASLTPTYCTTDMQPSIIKMTDFIVCNNAIIQKIDSSINAVGSKVSIEKSTSSPNTNCVLANLKNGNFAAAFVNNNLVYYAVLKESDLSYVKTLTALTGSTQSNPSITLLTNNNFIIVWGEGGNIKGQQFDLTGNSATSIKIINLAISVNYPVVKGVSNGFIVGYVASNILFYRLYNNDFTSNSIERYMYSAQFVSYRVSVDGDSTNMLLGSGDNTLLYAGFLYGSTPTLPCSNFSTYIGSGDTIPVKVPFDTTDANNYIYIISEPKNGAFTTSDLQTLSIPNFQYPESIMYYNFSAPAKSDSFTYLNTGEIPCTVTITPCNLINCSTCSGLGDATNNKCKTCNTTGGYYPLEDNATMCYIASAPPTGYYFNSSAQMWKKCYSSCGSCTGYPTDPTTDMKCSTCATGFVQSGTMCNVACYNLCKTCTGFPTDPTVDMMCKPNSCIATYFPKADKLTSCFSGNQNGYYFDGSMYQLCHINCQTCTNTPGTDANNQCTLCATGLYTKIDDTLKTCYKGDQPGYYFDTNIYKRCHINCKTCSGAGTDTNNQCTKCKDGYYTKIDDPTNCFTGDIPLYYNDSTYYQRCYKTCQTCKVKGTDTENNCLSCIDKYYPKVDDTLSCNSGDIPYYYLEGNIYQKCQKNCKTCTTAGTDSNNQCTSCRINFYPKIDEPQNCFAGDQPPYYFDGKIYQRCYPTCASCSSGGTEADNQCSTCINNYYPKIDSLTSCYTGIVNNYYLDTALYKNCYSSCKQCPSLGIDSEHECTECLDNYYPKIDKLTNCYTGELAGYFFNGTLYMVTSDQQSDGSTNNNLNNNNNNNQAFNSTDISLNQTPSCDPSPCLNGGSCSIAFNQLSCSCQANFTGSLCQYDENNLDLQAILKEFYGTQSDKSISDLFSIITNQPDLIDTSTLESLYQFISIIILTLVDKTDKMIHDGNVTEKTIDLLNLGLLIQSKIKNEKAIEKLKNSTIEANNLQIINRNLNPNQTVISGNSMFSSQMSLSGNDSMIEEAAYRNSMPIFNLKECEKILKEHYNITSSEQLIFVTNNFNSALDAAKTNKTNQTNSYSISVYHPVTKEKLNMDLCNDVQQKVLMPVGNNTNLNLTLYREMKVDGIDIYNPNDKAFNDQCMSYIDKGTQKDTTLNWRRENYYQQTTPQCGFNCTYSGINDKNYTECTCGINATSLYENSFFDYALDGTFSEFNFKVISCTSSIMVIPY